MHAFKSLETEIKSLAKGVPKVKPGNIMLCKEYGTVVMTLEKTLCCQFLLHVVLFNLFVTDINHFLLP